MSMSHQSWKDVPTGSVDVGGTKFVYRQLGPDTGIAVIFLNHLDRQAPAQDSQASGEGRSVPSGLSHLGNPAARAPLNPVPLGMWCNVGGPSAPAWTGCRRPPFPAWQPFRAGAFRPALAISTAIYRVGPPLWPAYPGLDSQVSPPRGQPIRGGIVRLRAGSGR